MTACRGDYYFDNDYFSRFQQLNAHLFNTSAERQPSTFVCSRCARGTNLSQETTIPTCKGKVHPVTCHDGTEGEWRYSSTLFFNLGAR
jgi:hypothetical protein